MTTPGGAHIALGSGKEFDGIRDLLSRWGAAATGIGDDAALLAVPRGNQVVVSVDAFVEGRHFRPEWITPAEIGFRAATAALSDLAAMAATPRAMLFAINVPDGWRERLGAIGDGVAEAAALVGARIVGGNISASTELSITTTVLGSAFSVLSRVGARVGERVYVTGALGGPGAAVGAWVEGRTPDDHHRQRFARPSARVKEARWLADRGATCCIDISDGLVADAGHLAVASCVGIAIELDRIPLAPGVNAGDAAHSGEEYELLVCAPSLDEVGFEAEFGIWLTEIGQVVSGPSKVAVTERGKRVAAGAGHDHFSA